MKIVDITEFYSERGGGVRSHLTTRGHFLCQLGHEPSRHCARAAGRRCPALLVRRTRSGWVTSNPLQRATPAVRPHLPPALAGSTRSVRRVRAERPDVLEAHSPYLARPPWWPAVLARRAADGLLARRPRRRRMSSPPLRACSGCARLQYAIRAPLAGRARAPRAVRRDLRRGRVAGGSLRAAGVAGVEHVPFGVDARTFAPAPGAPVAAPVDGATATRPCSWASAVRVREALGRRARCVRARPRPPRGRPRPLRRRARAGALERAGAAGRPLRGVRARPRALAAALASADVLVHGCPYETFGLGVAEAVACGLPVVVPDAGGGAESAAAACGEVYRSLDAEACASAIERLLARPRERDRALALDAAAARPDGRAALPPGARGVRRPPASSSVAEANADGRPRLDPRRLARPGPPRSKRRSRCATRPARGRRCSSCPNFHGRAPLLDDAAFCARLRELQAAGTRSTCTASSTRAASGTTPASAASRLAWLFAQRVASGGEAEMSDVTPDEGARASRRASACSATPGCASTATWRPRGRCRAGSLPLPRATAATASPKTTCASTTPPAGGRARASSSTGRRARPARLASTVAWCRVARHARALVPARIAIHPGDMRSRLVRDEVGRHARVGARRLRGPRRRPVRLRATRGYSLRVVGSESRAELARARSRPENVQERRQHEERAARHANSPLTARRPNDCSAWKSAKSIEP